MTATPLEPTPGPWRWLPPMTVMGPVSPVASDVAPRNGPLLAAAPELLAEVESLRAMLRKVSGAPGWWAALSYIDGAHGNKSRWSEDERALLRRAGLDRHSDSG